EFSSPPVLVIRSINAAKSKSAGVSVISRDCLRNEKENVLLFETRSSATKQNFSSQNQNFSLKLTRFSFTDSHKVTNGRSSSSSAHPAHIANSPFAASFRPILVIDLPFAAAFCRILVVADSHLKHGSKFVKLISAGYVGEQEVTSATLLPDGWMRTGDLCYEDSFLFIVDGLKDLVKYKGCQAAPAELEHLLLSHPEMVDAAVIP
ncbi:hypothetical protein CUMW_273320, partial [Citrus unshiu]